MSAQCVRGHKDELRTIASTFRSQADASKNSLQRVLAAKNDLDGGQKWIGTGATAFYKEMDGMVTPALKRMINALGQAGSVTQQIAQTLQQMETDASACFKVQ